MHLVLLYMPLPRCCGQLTKVIIAKPKCCVFAQVTYVDKMLSFRIKFVWGQLSSKKYYLMHFRSELYRLIPIARLIMRELSVTVSFLPFYPRVGAVYRVCEQ